MTSNLIVRDILFRTSETIHLLPLDNNALNFDCEREPFEARFVTRADLLGMREDCVVMCSANGDFLVIESSSGEGSYQYRKPNNDTSMSLVCALDSTRLPNNNSDGLFILTLDGWLQILSCSKLIHPVVKGVCAGEVKLTILNQVSHVQTKTGEKVPLNQNSTCMRTFSMASSHHNEDYSCHSPNNVLIAIGGRDSVSLYGYGYGHQTTLNNGTDSHCELTLLCSYSTKSTSSSSDVAVHSLDFCHAGEDISKVRKTISHKTEDGCLDDANPDVILRNDAKTAATDADSKSLTNTKTILEEWSIRNAAYLVVGMETGVIDVYRYEHLLSYTKNQDGYVVQGTFQSEVCFHHVEAVVGCSPPLSTGSYLGPAYVRAIPRYCIQTKSGNNFCTDRVGQFLVAWLDGRLAHCHIGSTTNFQQTCQTAQNHEDENEKYKWSTVRCLHTPDSLYRLDFFAENLKPPESDSVYLLSNNASDNTQTYMMKNEDAFADSDGKRYISCAASSWSGHTYIVHVLIYEEAIAPVSSALQTIQESVLSVGTSEHRDEVIYCFDSRLLLAGGASRTFSCALYRSSPSLIFVSADNSVRVAPELKEQLKKFMEPKLKLELIPDKC